MLTAFAISKTKMKTIMIKTIQPQTKDVIIKLSRHFRHLFRTLVSDEPLWQFMHQTIIKDVENLNQDKLDNQVLISRICYHSPILGNFLVYSSDIGMELPPYFFTFLKQLAEISKSILFFVFMYLFIFGFILFFSFSNA